MVDPNANVTPPTDSQSETNLSGIDKLQMPSSMLRPLDQNIANAEADRQSAGEYADAQIAGAGSDMRDALGDARRSQDAYAAQGPGPNDHIDTLMSASPWLIALSVFGGARSKLSANNLMAAQIGMIDGINKGDEQGFAAAHKKWSDEHEKLADLMNQKWSVYREMQKAYKGSIDAKQKALAVAEQAVRDARADKAHQMLAWEQSVRAGVALKAVNNAVDRTAETVRHNKEKEDIDRTREAGVAARAAAKAAAGGKTGVKEVDEATALIDKIIGLVNQPHTLSRVGTGGVVSRALETAGNVTGMTNDTSSHDLETAVSDLKARVVPLIIKGSRTAKDQREKIDKIVRGLNLGDTDQNTISALISLRDEISKTATPAASGKKIVATATKGGKTYVKYDDGTISVAPTQH